MLKLGSFALLTAFLSVISISPPVAATEKITSDNWIIVDLPDQRLVENKIHFNYKTILISQPRILNLSKNRLLTVFFPEMEGVFTLKIIVKRIFRGKSIEIERFAAITPDKGARKVRFDFTNDPFWKGMAEKITIALVGKDAMIAMPEIILEPPTILKRLAIFFEKWTSPVLLKGIITNQYDWPYFFGTSAIMALGGVWFLGFIILLFYSKFTRSISLPKALIIWSLIVWICVDLTQKHSTIGSLGRIKAMQGHYSDALGPYENEAKLLSALLEKNHINHINVLGDILEWGYLRYALLPIRVEPKARNESVIVLGSIDGVQVDGDRLKKNGRTLLEKIIKTGSTNIFTVYSGKRP